MTWQFMELGYDYSIDYNGRVGNKPIKWEYNQASNRRDVYEVHAAINKLKTTSNAFVNSNYSLDLGGTGKRIFLNGTDMQVAVYGNFDTKNITMTANFQHTGKWYEYFSGDSLDVTDVGMSLDFEPGEYMLWTDKYLGPKLNIGSINKLDYRLEIYPNPVNEFVHIYASGIPFNKVTIYNNAGQLVESTTYEIQNEEGGVDTSHLSKGLYFIEVSNTDGLKLRSKLIKN
jgi:hypothetical protein